MGLNTSAGDDLTIGDMTTVRAGSTLGNDVTLAANVRIGLSVDIKGSSLVGDLLI